MSHKVIFLDRDDTINKDVPYCPSSEHFEFLEGSLEAIKLFYLDGFKIIIITNQSGLSRGFFDLNALYEIHFKLCEEVESVGAKISDIFFCGCLPESGCPDRKPGIGLFLQAEKKYEINKEESFMIGDSESDVEAGINFGLQTIKIVSEGKDLKSKANYQVSNLLAAAIKIRNLRQIKDI